MGKGFSLVICPSCGKVNHKVEKGKADTLTQEIITITESLKDLRKSKNWTESG